MSHFYASIPVSARKTIGCARGHKSTGIVVRAASWAGAIETAFYYDEKTGKDMYHVYHSTHSGAGVSATIARGVVGEE